jgi:cytochrome c-type biogenesis protein CcmH/NrfF
MVFRSRRVSDGLWAKPFWLVVVGVMVFLPAAYCQKTDETPQETNQKIQQLAEQAQARHPTDTPIGSGDLL